MTWLEDTLRDLAARSRALQAPAAGENGPQPTGPAMGLGGFTGAGVVGNLNAQAQAMGLPADSPERLLANVRGYQKYLRRSGRRQDPLMGAAGGHFDEATGRTTDVPRARLLMQDGQALRVNRNQGNERQGLSFQQFELPGGQRVNVYYGNNGERTVIRLPRRR